MKKNDVRAAWYEITQAPGPSGNFGRYYAIRCRACGTAVSYHANGMTDEGLRKVFMRKKWEIGRRPNQHLCPDCVARRPAPRELEPAAIVAAPARSRLVLCSFCLEDREPADVIMASNPANACICKSCLTALAPRPPVPDVGALYAATAGARPAGELVAEFARRGRAAQAAVNEILAAAPASEAPRQDEAGDDAPADWWQELNNPRSQP